MKSHSFDRIVLHFLTGYMSNWQDKLHKELFQRKSSLCFGIMEHDCPKYDDDDDDDTASQ